MRLQGMPVQVPITIGLRPVRSLEEKIPESTIFERGSLEGAKQLFLYKSTPWKGT